ncbi:MAG: DNA-packaging protein [Oscillospiraceae bacterium]|nr:DNA-packaging protein [Oscillospiraceae bacterium]
MTNTKAKNAADALLDSAKKWLRRSSDKLNDEITQTMAAAFLDMKNAGIKRLDKEDPLIQQAVKLYLKAHFGYDDQPEKWEAAYERLKAALSLSSDYTRED